MKDSLHLESKNQDRIDRLLRRPKKLVERNGRGKPLVVTPAGVEVCREMATTCTPVRTMANVLGVKLATFERAVRRQSELKEAILQGTDEMEKKLLRSVAKTAEQGMKNYVHNVTIRLPESMTAEQMQQLKTEGLTPFGL